VWTSVAMLVSLATEDNLIAFSLHHLLWRLILTLALAALSTDFPSKVTTITLITHPVTSFLFKFLEFENKKLNRWLVVCV